MPDITMCEGIDCSLKDKCHRFLATPTKKQSYFMNSPIKNNECEYFYEAKKILKPPKIEK